MGGGLWGDGGGRGAGARGRGAGESGRKGDDPPGLAAGRSMYHPGLRSEAPGQGPPGRTCGQEISMQKSVLIAIAALAVISLGFVGSPAANAG